MEAYTVIEVKADGSTVPQVESETEILLVQDGTVSVGMLCYDDDDYKDVYIDHPENERELNPEAIRLVKEHCPQHLATKTSVVLICPEELAARMQF
ncbi:MAG: hypothetical protein JNL72_00465 [Flavipsychrobacter sp.]|nr:hypothetical protein [Flavipsychrobacter sp.]